MWSSECLHHAWRDNVVRHPKSKLKPPLAVRGPPHPRHPKAHPLLILRCQELCCNLLCSPLSAEVLWYSPMHPPWRSRSKLATHLQCVSALGSRYELECLFCPQVNRRCRIEGIMWAHDLWNENPTSFALWKELLWLLVNQFQRKPRTQLSMWAWSNCCPSVQVGGRGCQREPVQCVCHD